MRQNRLACILAGGALLWFATGALAQVTVSNLVVAQRPGTKLVDIQYDISSSVTSVYVSLSVSNAGVRVNAVSLSGNVGNVAPGTGKSIVWNMGTDWNGNLAELTFTLTAQPDYMVVDLSAWPAVTNFPVSYLDSVPFGGWSDEYKTTKLVLRRIPAGTFTMGSPINELGRDSNETQHSVTLTQPFYMGVFEVTQKQWERVMSNWPSYFTNSSRRQTRPVEQVSYNDIRGTGAGTNWPANGNVDANSFMGLMRSKTGLIFDLPTEAQWEHACRAGATNALNSGYNLTNTENDARMAEVGRYWYNGGSNYTANGDTSQGTAKVGSYLPNAWGLFDMHGNAWEWCLDWYGAYSTTETDPKGVVSGSNSVVRGGSLYSYAYGCRSACRGIIFPGYRGFNFGFRVSLPASQTATASSLLDSREYKLTVVSARATPSPAVGTNTYAWRASVTCSVAQKSLVSGVNWSNTGWTGTGSIPASGVTTNTGAVVLTNIDSTISWNWTTAFAVTNVVAAQRPGTKQVDIAYDIISDVTNGVPITMAIGDAGTPVPTNGATGSIGANILRGVGRSITWNAGTNWNGNSAQLTFFVRHSVETQLLASGAFFVDTRNYTLIVASVRGSPSPAVGTYSNFCWRSTVTASVGGAVGYTQVGWSGTGSIPATGATANTGAIVLSNLVSSISWNWTTNTYTVSFDAQGGSETVPTSKVVTYSDAYGVLPTTTRELYNFAGWWTASAGGAMITSTSTVNMASNHTLYAHWAIYTYPVTLHPGLYGRIAEANSNADYVANIAHGSLFPAVMMIPYAGYTFTGWNPPTPGAITTNFEATAQYVAISPPTYDVGVESVALTNNGNYIITGSTTKNTITMAAGIQANITLINVSVVLSNGCAFHMGAGSSANLILLGLGTNTFSSRADHAGIHLATNSMLSIASNSTAALFAQGGAGASGIGGGKDGNGGTIEIHGGTIRAIGGTSGAGIGGGYHGGGGSILIDGNAAVAAAGGANGAGIGGGLGGDGGNITIGGNAAVVGAGGSFGAGVGGGFSGAGGTVHIEDSASVTATGAGGGAGIGGGYLAAGGTVDIYAQATMWAGVDEGSAAVVLVYGAEAYARIARISPNLAILSSSGSNFVFSVATNGYSGYDVEGADCALLTGGAWNWALITNFTVNPDGSISVPLEGGARRIIRLKLTP